MKTLLRRVAAFLAELKRRKVYRVAVVYVIVAIGALELADVLVPATVLPAWSEEFFVVLAIVGFPIVVVLAWVFDVTPEGVRRETPATRDAPVGTGSPPPAGESAPAPPNEEAPTAGGAAKRVAAESGEARARPRPELDRHAVAVLPFSNLSEAPDAEPFAAGLHDDLLTELSRASALTVISRTSVQRYRASEKSIPEIGRELGAGTVVEGGV
ncbi:MAG: hypothetical protein R3266_02480, partial [Gemmatimonadota bacterium]|nr:hypothetical protein [Gemmatimonadota bacterium]